MPGIKRAFDDSEGHCPPFVENRLGYEYYIPEDPSPLVQVWNADELSDPDSEQRNSSASKSDADELDDETERKSIASLNSEPDLSDQSAVRVIHPPVGTPRGEGEIKYITNEPRVPPLWRPDPLRFIHPPIGTPRGQGVIKRITNGPQVLPEWRRDQHQDMTRAQNPLTSVVLEAAMELLGVSTSSPLEVPSPLETPSSLEMPSSLDMPFTIDEDREQVNAADLPLETDSANPPLELNREEPNVDFESESRPFNSTWQQPAQEVEFETENSLPHDFPQIFCQDLYDLMYFYDRLSGNQGDSPDASQDLDSVLLHEEIFGEQGQTPAERLRTHQSRLQNGLNGESAPTECPDNE